MNINRTRAQDKPNTYNFYIDGYHGLNGLLGGGFAWHGCSWHGKEFSGAIRYIIERICFLGMTVEDTGPLGIA